MIRKFYTLLFASMLIVSCSSDDGDASDDGASIVGVWDAIEFNTAIGLDLNDDGTASSNLLDELDCFEVSSTFTEEGTFTSTSSSILFEGTDIDFTLSCDDGVETNSGTYVLNGSALTTTDEDGDVESTVSITATRLTVSGEDEDFGQVVIIFERR